MKYTTNLQLKKPDYVDPADIGILNENMDIVDAELKKVESQLGEMENKKVNYTDLTPVVTTGTSSDYVATIPSGITEVTIVPHVNNLAGATLNGIPILDREGKPIGKDVLKMDIPTKLVRIGSNFFIASCGGNNGYIKPIVQSPVVLSTVGSVGCVFSAYGSSKDTELLLYTNGSNSYICMKKNGCRVLYGYLSYGFNAYYYTQPAFYSEANGYFYTGWLDASNIFNLLYVNSNPPYNFGTLKLGSEYNSSRDTSPCHLIVDSTKLYIITIVTSPTPIVKLGRFSLNSDGTIANELQNLTIPIHEFTVMRDFSVDNDFLYVEWEQGNSTYNGKMTIDKETLQVVKTVNYPKSGSSVHKNIKVTIPSRDGIHYWTRPNNANIEKRLVADKSLVKSIRLADSVINNEIFNTSYVYIKVIDINTFIYEDEDGGVYALGNLDSYTGCVFKILSDASGIEVYTFTNKIGSGWMINNNGGDIFIDTYSAATSGYLSFISPTIVSFN